MKYLTFLSISLQIRHTRTVCGSGRSAIRPSISARVVSSTVVRMRATEVSPPSGRNLTQQSSPESGCVGLSTRPRLSLSDFLYATGKGRSCQKRSLKASELLGNVLCVQTMPITIHMPVYMHNLKETFRSACSKSMTTTGRQVLASFTKFKSWGRGS